MKINVIPSWPLLALAALASLPSLPLRAATCPSLTTLQLPQTTIAAAQSVPAGSFTSPGGPVKIAVEFCRVAMVLKPSADSDIHVEIWLPASGWNGKFQGVGNGGFTGSIDFNALASAVAQ